MNKTFKEALPGLIWAGALILLALCASFARQRGYIDHDTTLRLVIGANGLMIAYFGNRAPKVVAPSVYAAQVARFAGWSMVLSGLVYTGLWAFAPIHTAITLGSGTVAVSILATLVYCLQLRARAVER